MTKETTFLAFTNAKNQVLKYIFECFNFKMIINRSLAFYGLLLFFNTANITAQCSNYQVYESIGSGLPTLGGTWTANSVTYTNGVVGNSGANQLDFDAIGDYIQTPLISTPGVFSFMFKRSGTTTGTPKFTVYTSPDATTWTARGSTGVFGITWAALSVNLGALGLTNVYVRIIDERASGNALRYVDDIAWTSTVSVENTFIPVVANCSQTIACGTTYTFTDQGGINDSYNISKDYTITFTPSVGTNKVELVFNAFDLQSGEDGMVIYNGPTTASPVISSGLLVGTNPTNCPAGSFYGTTSPGTITSTDASGAITIRFRSSSAVNNSGWIAGVTCVSPSACQKPTLTATTAITSTTATINWVAPSPAPSNGYEYVVSTANITPAGSGTFVAGVTANVSSLTPNTIYYVFVRSDCGGSGFSGWTSSGAFTTLLTPCIAPVTQASLFLPGTITSSTFPASFSGSANGYLVIQSTSATAPSQPLNGTIYSSGTISTLGTGLTFVQSAATTSFTTTALIGNTAYYYYIFAYNTTTCSGGPTYNISGPLVGTNNTCPAIPNTVGTASVTSSGFTLNWTAPTGGSASGLTYTVQVTTDSTYATGLTTYPVVAPITTLNVSGLSSNTIYYYRILASNGCSSLYVTGNVTTSFPACVAPVSQANGFALGTITSTSIPASFSGSANGYLVVRSMTSTPPTQPTNGTTYSAGNVASLGAAFAFIQSGAGTSISGTGLASSTQYYYFIYAFNNTSCLGGPVYTLSGPLTGTGTTLAGLNDDCATAIPLTINASCTYTTYTNAAATTSSTTGTPAPGCASYLGGDVWFSVVVPASGILILDSQVGTILDSGMALYSGTCGALTLIECDDDDSSNGAMSYINRTGLTPGSTLYVRFWEFSNDNNGTFGICASTVVPCVATNVPYTQNFDSVTQPALPSCVTVENTNNDSRFWKTCTTTSLGNATAINPISGTNQMGIQYDFTNAMNDWFYLQGLNLTAGTSYRLTFYTRAYNFTGTNEFIEVKYGTSPTSSTMTTSLFSTLTVIGNDPYIQKTIDFIPSSSGVFYIGFHAVSPANTWYLFVDDVSVTLSPSCLPPTVSDTTNITSTTATINWVTPLIIPANGYQYVVSTTNVTPAGSGTAVAGLNANISSLTANTTYYIFVRSDCGGGNFSTWTASASFYTGYCISTSTSSTYFINNFSTTGGISNITNNGSGYSATGFGNFTAQSVSQQPYGTVNFSSTYSGSTFGFNIWVDWNNDLDFDDAGEKVYGSGGYNASNTGNFTVPASASVGSHRMRIRANLSDTNPQACGSITNGETEDYTFTVIALACSGNPVNLPATGIGFTTATINWNAAVPAPASGYQYYYSTNATAPIQATSASGSTAAGITTANLTGLTSGSYYYVWVRSNCGANQGVWVGSLTLITNALPPVTTNSSVCPGGSATLTASGSCTSLSNLGNTINGAWDAGGDPRAIRPIIFIANSPTCQFDGAGLTSNYTSLDFQVSATGFYTFTMAATTAYDSMGYIVINPFNPGVCGSGTWVVGDDDSGPTTFEPMLSSTLNAGVTYTLISTLYSGSSITLTNTFQWNVTGPGTISGVVGGTVEWYTAASGGIPIGTGTPFNPVGVSGSGLSNSNTPGTYPFYAACPNNPNVRSAANYIINGPTATISGNGTTCGGSTPMSILLTGTSPWTFTYTDGTTPITVSGNTTNPYLFSVSPTLPTNYTITALNDANCTALPSNMTGIGVVGGSKTWSGTTSDWFLATNWTPNGVPTATHCVVIPNVVPSPIISNASLNAYAYNLTVLNGGILQVNTLNNITVTDVVNVISGGQFLIKNAASLIQINNVNNTGIINMERITQPMYRFDYTYWGCPLTFASNFTLGNLSPNTLSDKYFSWIPTVSNSYGTWLFETAATIMNPIKGYIVRAPQSFSGNPSTTTPYTANFIGTPNNGNIFCPIYHGTLGVATNNDKYNFLGNPYPSAVDAQAFLTDPINTPVIDGTIYFWTHNSPPSTTYVDPFYGDYVINYSSSDFASWNSLGAVGARGSAAASNPSGTVPNGFIAAGQGFFTKSTGTAISGNTVTFKNSMRVSGNNNQFFRQIANPIEKHRVWLNMINNGGTFNQILVGYIEGATQGWDRDYDGVRFTDNSSISFYSVLPERDLVIQGRPLPFAIDDQVSLGFKSNMHDTFSIRIDHFDGLFENQNIYLEDRLLNSIHDLKASPYSFISEPGTFNDRFVLRYTNPALGIPTSEVSIGLVAFVKDEKLNIQSSEIIYQIEVFDSTGKLIKKYIPIEQSKKIESEFIFAEGIYIAKIKLSNGIILDRKLVNIK